MFEQLFSLVNSIRPLSKELSEALHAVLQRDDYPKRTKLLAEGQVCDRIYFIEKGLARAFYYKEGQEITAWIMPENRLIISVYSLFMQQPSYENVELLEESTLISINYSNLQTLYEQFPEFNYIGRVLTERYYVLSEQRSMSLRRQTSQERFQALLQTEPGLFNRVQLKHIASYLGMTPETLSRLRAKIK